MSQAARAALIPRQDTESGRVFNGIRQTLRSLFPEQSVVEMRVLGVRGREGAHAAGWYDNMDRLAADAAMLDAQGPEGIYVTLNQVHPGCLARVPNGFKNFFKPTTSDKDIIRRQWLLLDFDPARPSQVSSTADELKAAKEKAAAVAQWLKERGWPRPLTAMSGNGYHVLYRIDLPADDESKTLVCGVLEALHSEFSDSTVKVDRTSVNPSRISKLWGTVTRKGAHLEVRPHRRSEMQDWFPTFEEVEPVSSELLAELARLGAPSLPPQQPRRRTAKAKQPEAPVAAATATAAPASGPVPAVAAAIAWVDGMVADQGLAVLKREPWSLMGMRWTLDACLFDSSHNGGSAALMVTSAGAICYKCQHDSCSGREWAAVAKLLGVRPPPPPGATPKRTRRTAGGGDDEGRPKGLFAVQSPMQWAKDWLETLSAGTDGPTVQRWWRAEWWAWNGTRYRTVGTDRELNARVFRWLDEQHDGVLPVQSRAVVEAILAQCYLPTEFDMPGWLPGAPPEHAPRRPDRPADIISVANGLLELGKPGEPIRLLPHSPYWFSNATLPYAYDPRATCDQWEAFLAESIEDPELIQVLQQWFGLMLTDDTSYQRIAFLIGPPRCGKGTILRTLTAMLGPEQCTAPQLSALASEFGLWPLLGHRLAVLGDIEIGKTVDSRRVLEVLKAISGEDRLNIRRMYLPTLTGVRLPTRIIMSANEMPPMPDTAGALTARLLCIPFFRSFAEAPDTTLQERLYRELPGILNWSLRGLFLLREAGRFIEPAASQEITAAFRRLSSPLATWIEDCAIVGRALTVSKLEAFASWKAWCKLHHHQVGSSTSFSERLRSICPLIREVRTAKEARARIFEGLALTLTGRQLIGEVVAEDA